MVVLLFFLLFRLLVRRRGPVTWSARTGVGRRRRGSRGGSRPRQVQLCQRRHELLVVAVLLRARATHVQHDVFVWVHLEEVAALVREVTRVAALLARRPYGVRRLVGEPGHHFAKRALHGRAGSAANAAPQLMIMKACCASQRLLDQPLTAEITQVAAAAVIAQNA